MEIREGIDGLKQIGAGAVMSIGNFDGLHLGHAQILDRMKALRAELPGCRRLTLVTFEPHPLTVLRPQLAPPRLTPYEVEAPKPLVPAPAPRRVPVPKPEPDDFSTLPESGFIKHGR